MSTCAKLNPIRVTVVNRAVSVKSSFRAAKVPVHPSENVLRGLACGIATSIVLSFTPATAWAQGVEYGAEVFGANCASCHTGGNNIVVPQKTLRKEALEQYLTGGFNKEAIIYQVTNGKGQMPAWGDKLDEEEILAVADYVYAQASNNAWS